MGQYEEASWRADCGSRTYFFDLKKGPSGARRLVISETKGGEHFRVTVFEDHLQRFADELLKAVSRVGGAAGSQPTAVRPLTSRAYEGWSQDEDAALRFLHSLGYSIAVLAKCHQRQRSAIRSRLLHLGLPARSLDSDSIQGVSDVSEVVIQAE